MRFRMGLAAGYWFGTAAGRERHEQLKQMVGKVKRSDAYETATEKAKAAVDLGVERAKDFAEEHTPLGHKDSPLSTANGTPTRI